VVVRARNIGQIDADILQCREDIRRARGLLAVGGKGIVAQPAVEDVVLEEMIAAGPPGAEEQAAAAVATQEPTHVVESAEIAEAALAEDIVAETQLEEVEAGEEAVVSEEMEAPTDILGPAEVEEIGLEAEAVLEGQAEQAAPVEEAEVPVEMDEVDIPELPDLEKLALEEEGPADFGPEPVELGEEAGLPTEAEEQVDIPEPPELDLEEFGLEDEGPPEFGLGRLEPEEEAALLADMEEELDISELPGLEKIAPEEDRIAEIRAEPKEAGEDVAAKSVDMERATGEIPTFDLAEEIMAEQRKITAAKRRRKGPGKPARRLAGKKTEDRQGDVGAEKTEDGTEQTGPKRYEQDDVIADIVSKDIKKLRKGGPSERAEEEREDKDELEDTDIEADSGA
jgi:hypothetical protein